MKFTLSRSRAAAVLLFTLLTACGGGGGGDNDDHSSAPRVTSITSQAPLSYARTATLLVGGSNLDQGITLSAPGCADLTEAAGGSASQRSYTCRVTVANMLPLSASSEVGGVLLIAALPVPDPQVTIAVASAATNGSFVLELDPAAAPISVQNFLRYVNDGFYPETLFHRVIANFVVQGGGFTTGPTLKPPTHPPIALESNNGLSNTRGTVGMARTSAPNSATSQFYVNVQDNPDLDFVSAAQPGFAVFGMVVGGMEVIDAIRNVPTTTRSGLQNVPVDDVVIESAMQTR